MTVPEMLAALTPRELEIVKQIASDVPNKAIADVIGCAARTVEHHRENLYKKLGVNSSVSVTHFALAAGLVPNKFL